MAFISVKGLRVSYGKHIVFEDFELEAEEGEFVVLVGPNGCGKSTLISILAGELLGVGAREISVAGQVTIAGAGVSDVRRSLVLQDNTSMLHPWRTAFENLAYPLELEGLSSSSIDKTLAEFLGGIGARTSDHNPDLRSAVLTVGNRDIPLARFPYQLSGGQRQVVALISALVHKPVVLLMDEPFSALDWQTGLWVQDVIAGLTARSGVTTVMATHSLDEAVFLGDRILFLTQVPAKVHAALPVMPNRPRGLQFLYGTDYATTRASAMSYLKQVLQ